MSMDVPVSKMAFYDTIAEKFDDVMNRYDVNVRLSIVFDEFLSKSISDWLILDAGCGTGLFSQKARERGANMVSLDYSKRLVKLARGRAESIGVNGDALSLPFRDGSFDAVISSEMIEHTPDPLRAINEMIRVLKCGGYLALTTPNLNWKWSIYLAELLHMRPYRSNENWLSQRSLRRCLAHRGMRILALRGFHLLPFQIQFFTRINAKVDRLGTLLAPCMINTGVFAVKEGCGAKESSCESASRLDL